MILLLGSGGGSVTLVDTRDKRASVLNIALPSARVFPNPNGSLLSVGDRQHIDYNYRFDTTADGTPSGDRGTNVVVGLLLTIHIDTGGL